MPANFKDIAYVSTGMTPLKSESKFYENGNIPWVTSTLTSSDYIDKADTYITEFALNNTTLDLYPVHTLILAMYGQGTVRKTGKLHNHINSRRNHFTNYTHRQIYPCLQAHGFQTG